jgi:hypothetical protein
VPSAGAAAGASAAGAAGASAAGAAGALSVVAGGAAAVSGLAASCFAQAVSISAATSALRASLVFIDRYPKEKQEWYENDMNEFCRSASPVRIAAANSIESPLDLKQSERVVSRSRQRAGAVCTGHTTDGGASRRRPQAVSAAESAAVIWQAVPYGEPFGAAVPQARIVCFHWSR